MKYTDEDLRIMLEKLLEVNPDIQGAAIISVQGLPICFMLAHNTNEELVSAMSAAIFTMSEHAVKELIRGDLKQVLIEGNEGIIILSKAGENAISCILLGSTDQNDNGFPTSFPTISPSSPGTASSAKQKVQEVIIEEEPDYELYCKFCGSKLAKKQKFCSLCGKNCV